MLERGTADENYRTLTTFFDPGRDRLEPGGRILLSFGTTGDIDYLHLDHRWATAPRSSAASRVRGSPRRCLFAYHYDVRTSRSPGSSHGRGQIDHADVLHEHVHAGRPHEAVSLRLQPLRECV